MSTEQVSEEQGFNEVFGDKTVPVVETPNEPENQTTEIKQTPAEPKYRQITEDEFNDLIKKVGSIEEMRSAIDKRLDSSFGSIGGKLGGLEETLRKLQGETPSGQPVELSESTLAELSEEYPELVGPMLAAFQRLAGNLRGTAPIDDSRIHQAVNPLLDKAGESVLLRAKSEMASEALDETHTGWREIIGLPDEQGNIPDTDYRKWLATQSQDYQDRINNSYSAVVLGRSIDKFREHQESKRAEADKQRQQAESQRRNRFEDAVTDPGDGGNEMSADEDDENAAFNAEFERLRR